MASNDEGELESAGQSLDPGELRRGRHQSLIFGSGSRMSRELFRELSSAEGPSAVSAFQAFMHTSVALGERRAGVVSTKSGETRRIPMNDAVREVLRALPSRLKSPWVFPSKTGETPLDPKNFMNRVFV